MFFLNHGPKQCSSRGAGCFVNLTAGPALGVCGFVHLDFTPLGDSMQVLFAAPIDLRISAAKR